MEHYLVISGCFLLIWYFYKPNSTVKRRKKRKTIVLDLDETLVHSSLEYGNSDFQIEVLMDKKSVIYHVYKRPYCDYFLEKVSEWYNVVIYTASVQEYADPVIDHLCSHNHMFFIF
jgi:TFIIF-interacting CTD phosphatase-like protein